MPSCTASSAGSGRCTSRARSAAATRASWSASSWRRNRWRAAWRSRTGFTTMLGCTNVRRIVASLCIRLSVTRIDASRMCCRRRTRSRQRWWPRRPSPKPGRCLARRIAPSWSDRWLR
uniref:(northern house mosquito) hypothetical protein n=1 Tax=Culex pipiens TaxID=7175 RepID=A0A8D8HDS6_CULPI